MEYEVSNRKQIQFCMQWPFSLLSMTEALVHNLLAKALHTEPVLINPHLLSSLQAEILCLKGIHLMWHFSGHNWPWIMLLPVFIRAFSESEKHKDFIRFVIRIVLDKLIRMELI